MEQRLKKLNISQIMKIYFRIKGKKTSLKKNDMIYQLLQPLKKKYKMENIKSVGLKKYLTDYLGDREAGKTLTMLSKTTQEPDLRVVDKRHREYDRKLRKYSKQAIEEIDDTRINNLSALIRAINRNDILLPYLTDILEIINDPLSGYPNTFGNVSKEDMLMIAANHGYTDIARILISLGTDVNARDDNGTTAFEHAIRRDRAKIIKMLLEKGVKSRIDSITIRVTEFPPDSIMDLQPPANTEGLKMLIDKYEGEVNMDFVLHEYETEDDDDY